jgi:hypothetical protein
VASKAVGVSAGGKVRSGDWKFSGGGPLLAANRKPGSAIDGSGMPYGSAVGAAPDSDATNGIGRGSRFVGTAAVLGASGGWSLCWASYTTTVPKPTTRDNNVMRTKSRFMDGIPRDCEDVKKVAAGGALRRKTLTHARTAPGAVAQNCQNDLAG